MAHHRTIHHTIRCHAIPLSRRTFSTGAARRLAEEDAEPKERRGFRLKGKEVRQALEWLESSGEQYRRPTPGRPNYLRPEDGGGHQLDAQSDAAAAREDSGRSSMLGDMEAQVGDEVAQSVTRRMQQAVKPSKLPPNPRPYGLNLYYRSERVLSEELKEAIYLQWAEHSASLKDISQRYFVCVERVGAVIRMKQIERNWLKEVGFLLPYFKSST
jgi:hypothetical protein